MHRRKVDTALKYLAGHACVHAWAMMQLRLPDLNGLAGPADRPQLVGPKTTGEKSDMQSKASRRKDGEDPCDCLVLEARWVCLGGQFSPALLP